MIIQNTWQGYWSRHHTHEYGMCFPDHKLKKFWVNIPKCATNWGKSWAKKNKLRISNYHSEQLLEKGYQPIVFLRDPVDRWYTGMAEWIHRYGIFNPNYTPTEEVLSVLLERVAFDEHTEEQVVFLENIDTNNAVFFRVDDNLSNNFKHYCEHELNQDPNLVLVQKSYSATGKKKVFKERLKECLTNSIYNNNLNGKKEVCELRLKNYYELDYQLYNSVQYYIKGEQ
jgi:hypothetical protein